MRTYRVFSVHLGFAQLVVRGCLAPPFSPDPRIPHSSQRRGEHATNSVPIADPLIIGQSVLVYPLLYRINPCWQSLFTNSPNVCSLLMGGIGCGKSDRQVWRDFPDTNRRKIRDAFGLKGKSHFNILSLIVILRLLNIALRNMWLRRSTREKLPAIQDMVIPRKCGNAAKTKWGLCTHATRQSCICKY